MKRQHYIIGGGVVLAGVVLLPSLARATWLWPDWVSPIKGGVVGSGWGDDRAYRDGKHEGVDFFVPVGTPIYAVDDGVVVGVYETGQNTGKFLIIDHGDFISRYLHLDSYEVSVGERVSRGQFIAYSGNTGISSSPAHLHMDVWARAAALEDYRSRFGTPSPPFTLKSWTAKNEGGVSENVWSVPAEALVPAKFTARVVEAAKNRGVAV